MVSRARIVEIIRNVTRMAATLGVVCLALITVASTFAPWNEYLDWLVSFPHWYVGFAFVGAVALALTGAKHRTVFAVGIMLFHGFAAFPYTTILKAPAAYGACNSTVDVLVINAFVHHPKPERVAEYVADESPDVLYVSELTPTLHRQLVGQFKNHFGAPRKQDGYGMALYTNLEIEDAWTIGAHWGVTGQIVADLKTPIGRTVRIFGVHPPAPFVPEAARIRNGMIEDFADEIATSPHPVLLIGDLNITMWSSHFEPLSDAGLLDARRGRGLKPTFPAWMPLRVPIDHVLHTDDLQVCSYGVGENIGSDHLPLHATVGLPQ